eukprot:TRINITY_DN12198_c0_g1_i1.p1 TRINITY_DN12198_c0_g1~~TRINITY_DN12198_c0_g1_i1.p1  ORF type:complete len:1061 (+),score=226.04 TRINITY_DN12198_c0_g1_i1:1854-5036(+)
MVRGFQRELSVMNRNLFIRLLLLAGAHAARITLLPWQDTTIYEPNAQQSNMEIGGGNSVFLVAGLTGNSLERRALLQFDLNVLPANAKVTSASLELHFDKSKEASLSVFRLTSTWTAGKETVNNSHAGQGSLAINGSSWNIRDANGQSWQQPGGDYATPATDAQSFGESAKDIIFNVTADVLAMLGDVDNYGWIIAATDANATGSAVRLYSSEYDNFSLRPALTIEFQPQRQHNFACFHRFANAADCNNIEVEEQSVRCEAVDECVAIDGYLSMVQSCTEEGAVDVQMYAGSTPCSAEPISTNIYEDNECTLHLEKHGYFTCEKRSLNPSTTEAPTKTTTSPALASSVASQSTTTQSGSKKVYDICVERYASDSCPSGMQLSSRCERQARCQSEATGRSTTYRCLDGVVEVETFEGSETCDGVPTKTQNLTESACVELAPTFAKIECVPKIIPVDKVELSLEATHDATLFQTANINETSLASGGDDAIFVGRTRQRAGIALRRSVIGFDLTRLTLPEGELVKAELVLSVVRVSQNAPDEATTITAHRVTSAWVEGNNSASGTNSAIDPNGGAGGTGVNATAGATWYYSDLVASTTWATPGGDYETDSSSFGTVEESKQAAGLVKLARRCQRHGEQSESQLWLATEGSRRNNMHACELKLAQLACSVPVRLPECPNVANFYHCCSPYCYARYLPHKPRPSPFNFEANSVEHLEAQTQTRLTSIETMRMEQVLRMTELEADTSMTSAFTRRGNLYMTPEEEVVYKWHISNLEFANATLLDNLSLKHWDQDDAFEFAGAHHVASEGYDILPKYLAASLDVRYNHSVAKVEQTEEGVRLQFNDGSLSREFATAVVAVPLGVLKHDTPSFEPNLPASKQLAIEQLGFGVLNKVALCFSKVFWSDNSDMFGICNARSEPRGSSYMFWNFHPSSRKAVLLALNAGPAALETETWDDEAIVASAMDRLQRTYKHEMTGVKLLHSHVTRWGSDESTRGSYSYVAQGCTGQAYDDMAAPVLDGSGKLKVLFAGEHTTREYPATVHGAFLSGIREASRLCAQSEQLSNLSA